MIQWGVKEFPFTIMEAKRPARTAAMKVAIPPSTRSNLGEVL